MRPRLRHLLPLAAVAALGAPTAAQADELVAELTRDTPIAAYGRVLAWSAHDAATGRYRLMLATAAGIDPAPVRPSAQPFDVSLGPDRWGNVVALYSRCTSRGTRCDIYRYELVGRRERRLGFSSPSQDEGWPTQWRDRVAFVRRHSTGGRGEISDCDVPYVKTLTSSARPRRLDRGSCGLTTGLSLRRERIVQVTFGTPASATRFDSQVRVLSARGGAARVVARQGSGEESNELVSPNQSAGAIWLTRTGVNPEPTFVVIDLNRRTPRMREVRAHTELTGSFARDDRGVFWYVEGGGFRGDGCAQSAPVPCRLVRATVSPFSPLPRPLLPKLTIASTGERVPSPVYGDPFEISGRLTRNVVVLGTVTRTDPIAGVPVALLRRVKHPRDPAAGTRLEPTGIVAATGADGRWSTTLAGPPSQPWFSAVASAPAAGVPTTYAGRGTGGSVLARLTLTVSDTTFAGTIAPAQSGRTVKLERLESRKCRTLLSGQRFCAEQWTPVADAPVNATGTGFAITLPAAPPPGIYSASLPFADQERDPAAYAGRSPDVPIG